MKPETVTTPIGVIKSCNNGNIEIVHAETANLLQSIAANPKRFLKYTTELEFALLTIHQAVVEKPFNSAPETASLAVNIAGTMQVKRNQDRIGRLQLDNDKLRTENNGLRRQLAKAVGVWKEDEVE